MATARLTTHETKAARLLVLYRLREAGLLASTSDANLAKALGTRRETIWKDRQALALAEQLYEAIVAQAPWLRPVGLTATEAAARLGCDAETLRYMLRDGLLQATKDESGRWRIAEAEIARLRQDKRSDWRRANEEEVRRQWDA